jgi:hypothetical protein
VEKPVIVDRPQPKRAPLTDLEVQDELHRVVFILQDLTGATTVGDTALKTARAACLTLLASVIVANEKPQPPSPDEQR